jgi:hypothetical protein
MVESKLNGFHEKLVECLRLRVANTNMMQQGFADLEAVVEATDKYVK